MASPWLRKSPAQTGLRAARDVGANQDGEPLAFNPDSCASCSRDRGVGRRSDAP